MQIRESSEKDKGSIYKLVKKAFGETEGDIVSQLSIDLLEDEKARPILSLVAVERGEIIGNILFSSVKIEGFETTSVYILAPLAIQPDAQGKGIGTKLILHGLELLKKRGAVAVLVLGDPKYYARTGFKSKHNLEAPYELEDSAAWMAQELELGVLGKLKGKVHCAEPLNSPKYW